MKLSELFEVDPANDATVSISSQHLLNEVKMALQDLACSRFVKAMTERRCCATKNISLAQRQRSKSSSKVVASNMYRMPAS